MGEDIALVAVGIAGVSALFATLRGTYADRMRLERRSDPEVLGPAPYRVRSILVAMPAERRADVGAAPELALPALLAAIEQGARSACSEEPARSRSEARQIASRLARRAIRPPGRRSATYRASASSIVPAREGLVVVRCILATSVALPGVGAAEALRAVAEGSALAPIVHVAWYPEQPGLALDRSAVLEAFPELR